jgi:hypothetical protein
MIYKITAIHRTIGMTQEDAYRIGKRCTIEQLEVGKPAFLRYFDIENRGIRTTNVETVDRTDNTLLFQTKNTHRTF